MILINNLAKGLYHYPEVESIPFLLVPGAFAAGKSRQKCNCFFKI
jgi:hypothetical protein